MSYNRSDRIRRAAILVASIEEELAERLLASLPPLEVERIYAELEALDEIDPDEQRDVLDEFRGASRRSDAAVGGVEFTYSQPVVAARPAPVVAPPPAVTSPLGAADQTMLARLLADEHPQTIAAALSRLGGESGAAVFAALPARLQPEVLERVANLDPTDDSVLEDMESHLVRRVNELQHRQERRAAGAALARQLAMGTAPAARDILLGRISAHDGFPTGGGAAATPPPLPSSPERRAAELLQLYRPESADGSVDDAFERGGDDRFTAWEEGDGVSVEFSDDECLEDCSAELEALSDGALLTAIHEAEEAVVQRALAASSERFVRRVARKLPRRHAKELHRLLRSLGPTRLADLRLAQRQLLEIARDASSLRAA